MKQLIGAMLLTELKRPLMRSGARPPERIRPRDRAIMEVLCATAIRRTELTRLGVWDVDWARSTLMVQLGKGGKDRVVSLGERAKAWLEAIVG
jgi:integrase/recombinase XerD